MLGRDGDIACDADSQVTPAVEGVANRVWRSRQQAEHRLIDQVERQFGGDWPAPIAWRRIASTITMRVKEVIISTMDGSSVTAVISINSCRVSE